MQTIWWTNSPRDSAFEPILLATSLNRSTEAASAGDMSLFGDSHHNQSRLLFTAPEYPSFIHDTLEHLLHTTWGFPGGSDGKESACNAGDLGLISGVGRPLEEGVTTHSSILAWRIPMDRGAWWATVHGITKSQTQLSD